MGISDSKLFQSLSYVNSIIFLTCTVLSTLSFIYSKETSFKFLETTLLYDFIQTPFISLHANILATSLHQVFLKYLQAKYPQSSKSNIFEIPLNEMSLKVLQNGDSFLFRDPCSVTHQQC